MSYEHPQEINRVIYSVGDGEEVCRVCAERLGYLEDLTEAQIEEYIVDHPVCDPDVLCPECVAFAAGIHPDQPTFLDPATGDKLSRIAVDLNRIVTQVSPDSTLQGFEFVAMAFAMLLDIYAAPNDNNPKGMCDDPLEFRNHFCETIMAFGLPKSTPK